jgi:hypothetical protein
VRVLAVIVARVLMAVAGLVLVRSGVRMGVTQGAVTVQVAFDGFIGGGEHRPVGLGARPEQPGDGACQAGGEQGRHNAAAQDEQGDGRGGEHDVLPCLAQRAGERDG